MFLNAENKKKFLRYKDACYPNGEPIRVPSCGPPELVKKYVAWVEIKVMDLPNQRVKLRLHATKICAALNI